VGFDLEQAKAFLADWDAFRANRSAVARKYGFHRVHAYDVAERCRGKISEAEAKDPQMETARTPLAETRG
jgi:hypothetical protein